jgi:hypothetical protein
MTIPNESEFKLPFMHDEDVPPSTYPTTKIGELNWGLSINGINSVVPKLLGLISSNVVVSVAIVLVNKIVFKDFHYPITLTLFHQASCWAWTRLMISNGQLTVAVVPTFDKHLVAISNVLGLLLMNASLSWNSVSVYQLSKLTCIPCIVILQRVLFREAWPHPLILVSLGLIVSGVAMASVSSFAAHPIGLLLALAAVITTSLSQVSLQHTPSFKGLSGWQSVSLISPTATIVLILLSIIIEVPKMINGELSLYSFNAHTWIGIFMSSIFAILCNYTGNSVIQQASALAYNIVGHLKSMLILIAGYTLFVNRLEDSLSPIKFYGIILSLTGMGFYSHLKTSGSHYLKELSGITYVVAPFAFYLVFCNSLTSLYFNVNVISSITSAPKLMFAFQALCVIGAIIASYCVGQWSMDDRQFGVQGITNVWREFGRLNKSEDASSLRNSPIVWDRRRVQSNDLNGQRVVVLSADNRPLQKIRDISPAAEVESYSTYSAVFNTWWAVRHGYDYRRVELSAPVGFHSTWAKVKAIYDMLFRYDIVVFFDGDVIVSQPDLGLKDMMQKWGFHERASILMALEPPMQPEPNGNGTNTGFIIVRSTPLAKQVFRRLTFCALGEVPPGDSDFDVTGCKEYQRSLYHEQTVFNRFLRPLLKEGEEFIISPCEESNGWWTQELCKGTVITHAWTGKAEIIPKLKDLMLRHHLELYEKLLSSDYHYTECSHWSRNDERCQLAE